MIFLHLLSFHILFKKLILELQDGRPEEYAARSTCRGHYHSTFAPNTARLGLVETVLHCMLRKQCDLENEAHGRGLTMLPRLTLTDVSRAKTGSRRGFLYPAGKSYSVCSACLTFFCGCRFVGKDYEIFGSQECWCRWRLSTLRMSTRRWRLSRIASC